MARTWSGILVVAAVLTGVAAGAAEPVDEGRRHFLRGMAAIELAKDDADLAVAADEFKEALVVDPLMEAAWYNLAAVEVKMAKFEEAIAHYRRYLEVAPNAEDGPRVRDELVKLEFKQERLRSAQSRAGWWIGSDSTSYEVKVDGDRIWLHASQRFVTVADVRAIYTLMGARPVNREVQDFRLTVRGDKLQGTWHRDPIKADLCTVPEEGGEVTGRLEDRESRIVLRYTRSSYEAPTLMSLFVPDHCGGVTVTGRREIELVLRGPVPAAGLRGVSTNARVSDVDGWPGKLVVERVAQSSAAQVAGLREKDVITAIEGAEVKGLSAGECLWRLTGKAGTVVNLLVLHKGAEAPVAVAVPLEDDEAAGATSK